MADLVVASSWRGERIVFEYDEATRVCFAIRVDDPNGDLPEVRIVKQGLSSNPTTGTIRYALPANRRFSIDADSEWPRFSFGVKARA